jgi:hypothetical protein
MDIKRNIYWFADPIPDHQDFVHQLAQKGHQLWQFANIKELMNACRTSRPHVLVVGDEGVYGNRENLYEIALDPELKGIHKVLCVEDSDSESILLSASLNFRDIIPSGIGVSEWLKRLAYSTHSKPIAYSSGEEEKLVPKTSAAKIFLPSRLISWNKDEITVETSGVFQNLARTNLEGNLRKRLAEPSIEMIAKFSSRKKLKYRHTMATVFTVNIQEARFRLEKVCKSLSFEHNDTPDIYFLLKSPMLRNHVRQLFPNSKFNCLFATRMSRVAQEIQFFRPDVMIVEPSLERIVAQSADVIRLNVDRIISIGNRENSLLTHIENVDFKSHLQSVAENLLVQDEQKKKGHLAFVPLDHDLANCALSITGLDVSESKSIVQFTSPIAIKRFAFFAIEWGRRRYLCKTTDCKLGPGSTSGDRYLTTGLKAIDLGSAGLRRAQGSQKNTKQGPERRGATDTNLSSDFAPDRKNKVPQRLRPTDSVETPEAEIALLASSESTQTVPSLENRYLGKAKKSPEKRRVVYTRRPSFFASIRPRRIGPKKKTTTELLAGTFSGDTLWDFLKIVTVCAIFFFLLYKSVLDKESLIHEKMMQSARFFTGHQSKMEQQMDRQGDKRKPTTNKRLNRRREKQ